nr:MAG TPA: portal protein [Caudoviricetes sp.]
MNEMERKLLEAMSREEPLSLPAADSSPTEGSLWQAGQANLDEEGLMGRQMPGSATEDGESLAGVLDSEPAIGEKEISEAMAVLEKYKSAKASLDKRIIDNEEWYKLGHWKQYGNRVMEGKRAPSTGWLFNSIANKHADAMDNYPEPNVLPRAQDDEETAKLLSDILPVVLEQADYESVYSDTWWRKLKQGTGVKGIFWDPALREGLGDIAIRSMDLLMLYWEPGVEDIQDSANFFSLALADNDRLAARWPQLEGKAGSSGITVGQYVSDQNIDTSEKSVVVDWYYKREKPGSQTVVHYCKFCNGVVLYASENAPAMAETGFYDHGKYPFVFDPLFVEENSPAGFGYIDVMKDTQDAIDRMTQAMDENTLAAAKKRYLISDTAGVNEDELLDTAKDVVHITGRLDERGFMELETAPLPSNTIAYQQNRVAELKENSGNRDVNQGGTTSGLTAASAIAALQEAGSKLSRDMLKSSYRSFAKECYFIIDLMRQFYDESRVYRITGQQGGTEYREFSGQMLRPQPVESVGGVELGAHEPVFDITVSAAKKSTFSRLSQNETAKECYQLGFFAPANADAALACLDMMDFEGIEKVRQRVAQNGTLYQQLQQAMAQIQQMAAVIDQQNGSNLSEQAGAAAAAMTGGGGGGETSAKTVTNSLGGQVGGGTNPLATKAAERAMNINNPNK